MIMSGDGRISVDRGSVFSNGISPAAGRVTSIRRHRHRGPLGLWRVAIALPVAACDYSPTMDLLGSYFPAWMLCAAIGIAEAQRALASSTLGRMEPLLGRGFVTAQQVDQARTAQRTAQIAL